MLRIGCILIIVILFYFNLLAEEKTAQGNEKQQNYVQEISDSEEEQQMLINKFNLTAGALKGQVEKLELKIFENEKIITQFQNEQKKEVQSSIVKTNISILGAITLMLGLLLEIIGATLIAGKDLAEQLNEIDFNTSASTGKDLALQNPTMNQVLNFWAKIGVFILLLGFLIQAIGILIVLPINIFVLLIIVAILFIIVISVFYAMLRISPDQKISTKFKIIVFNIKRLLISKKKSYCDRCLKIINTTNSDIEIWWMVCNTTGTPYNFRIGHKSCLEENVDSSYYCILNDSYYSSEVKIMKVRFNEFKTKYYEDIAKQLKTDLEKRQGHKMSYYLEFERIENILKKN